jgi:hypothetical protein
MPSVEITEMVVPVPGGSINADLVAPAGAYASRVAVVPGATHVFADAQHVEHAAHHAALWFRRHLGRITYRPPIAEEACVE